MQYKRSGRTAIVVGLSIVAIPVALIFGMIVLSGFEQGAGMMAAFLAAFFGPWILGAAAILILLGCSSLVMARPGTIFEKWKPFLRVGGYLLIIYLFILFLSWVAGFDFGNDPLIIRP